MVFRTRTGLVLAACLAAVPAARADKLDKESKQWLDDVAPIMLVAEEKTFKELKDKSERQEFQKIFWARRDPDLETPANEFQAQYAALKAEVDAKYRQGGRLGSQTDCGRIHILLGPPDNAKAEADGRQTWTFKDRPGIKFKDGSVQIGFDGQCMLPEGQRMADQLQRMAETRIAQPNLDYRMKDGKLVKLADQLPKPSPVQALLKAPRQDFPLAAENKLMLKGGGGAGTYAAGLVRGETALAGGVLGLMAVDEAGKTAATADRELSFEAKDGGFIASYGLALKPGRYDLKIAVLDPKTNKGSVTSMPLVMPDLSVEELSASPLLVLAEIQEGVTPNALDPYWGFTLGTTRFVPRFGNVFSTSDAITLIAALYNPKPDEASGKPSASAAFTIAKDGKVMARADESTYDTPTATPSVGPVPLAKYAPGKYVAQVKVRDNVAKRDVVQESAFEVK